MWFQGGVSFSDHRSVKSRRANEGRVGRGWRKSCSAEGGMAIEWRPRISSAQILPGSFDGVGGRAHQKAFGYILWPFAFFRTDAPLCDKSGCEEWREGLQGLLHCVSRDRGKGCSNGEYGFQASGYVSRL